MQQKEDHNTSKVRWLRVLTPHGDSDSCYGIGFLLEYYHSRSAEDRPQILETSLPRDLTKTQENGHADWVDLPREATRIGSIVLCD